MENYSYVLSTESHVFYSVFSIVDHVVITNMFNFSGSYNTLQIHIC